MRKMKVPAYLGSLFLSMCVASALLVPMASTPALHAQAPAAGASVSVRMIEAVDSGKDPAGKQYRASVTKTVDAGNGVVIPQGAAAAVTLVNSGSGWTTQLVSVTINGQPVAVASSSASVTSAAQSAANNAVSTVGSMLGGFGHHVSAPTGVTAVAMGQRVVLPPGATLTFVLGQTPAPAANAQPSGSIATAAPPPPAAAPASGPGTWYRCNIRGSTASRMVVYVSPFIHTTANTSTLQQAWQKYMVLTYHVEQLVAEAAQCETFGDSADQRAYAMSLEDKGWSGSNTDLTHVDWTYTPAEVAATNQAAATSDAAMVAAGPALGPNQTYALCFSDTSSSVVYFSDIFAVPALPPGAERGNGGAQRAASAAAATPFQAFLKKKYGVNDAGTCVVSFMPTPAGLRAAQDSKQRAEDTAKRGKAQIVETGWKNTP